MGRRPILERPKAFLSEESVCSIVPPLGGVFSTQGHVTYVLLTRPPLFTEVKRSTCMC